MNIKNKKYPVTQPSLLVLLVLFSNSQFSYAKDLYTVGVSSSSTSDNIDLNTLQFSYINNQREHFWPYKKTKDSVIDFGIDLHNYNGQAEGTDFTGQHFEGIVGAQITDNAYIGLKLGQHNLDVPDTNSQQTRGTYDTYVHLGFKENITIKVNLADDYVYKYGLQPAGAREFLNAKMRTIDVNWKPIKTVRISFRRSKWILSDANTRYATNASILYGISPGWPWIWIGATYEKLEFDKVMPEYWTPNDFHAAGIIFESNFPIKENFTGGISASVTNSKEDNNSQGNGGSLNIGLDYNLTNTHTVRFNFSRIISQQKKSEWYENTFNISFNGSF